jgi:hypothetical protein
MLANAVFVAVVIFLALAFTLMGQLRFLIPWRALLWHEYWRGILFCFLLRHEHLLRSLPSSEIVYLAESKRHFLDAGRMLSRAFPKLDATTVAARECPRGVHHFLSYLEARQVFEEGLASPTFEQSRVLAEGKSIYKTVAHDQLFDTWMRDDITDEEIVARYSEKRIHISIRGYVIRAAFPQNGPKYRGVE